MTHEDPHSLSFNLLSNIGCTTRIPILFPEDYEVWALHFEDYVLGIEEHRTTIWPTMTQETNSHTGTRKLIKSLANYNALVLEHTDIP